MTILIPTLMGGLIGGSALLNRNLGSASHLAIVTDDAQFAANLQTEMTPTGPSTSFWIRRRERFKASQGKETCRWHANRRDSICLLSMLVIFTARAECTG